MKIKLLSPLTISRIAAGEVVERPASVVKELVENSIDALATELNILIGEGGRNLISITDNGIGMNKSDLEIAADRHTTSKLDEEDIFNIKKFGFRGEALPSIASISRVTITSKAKEEDIAWSIDITGGDKGKLYPSSLKTGTKIEVKDLFFATPARLKFLRSERTELQFIIDIIDKLAIANPSIAFNLSTKNKLLSKYNVYDTDHISKRIGEVLGTNFVENSLEINEIHNNIKINGLISIPTFSKSAPTDQYFYVNNRPVKDKLLSSALKVAYQDFISNDRHSVIVIFIELPPEDIDVNVHPAKSEVRFRDPNNIRSLVINAIKNVISLNKNTSSILADKFMIEATKNIPGTSYNPSQLAIKNNQIISESKIGFDYPKKVTNIPFPNIQNNLFNNENPPVIKPPENNNETVKNNVSYLLGAAICQLHENYIVSQTEDSIIIVDQHAAHERIIYEKLKYNQNSSNIKSQRLLIPEIIEFDQKRLDKIMEIEIHLKSFGLKVKQFGNSIMIEEVPEILGYADVKSLIIDLADDLIEYEENISITKLIEHILETFACHHSIRSGRKLSIPEMNSLLREMENTQNSSQCNHGRPTYIKLKLSDIENLFGRR